MKIILKDDIENLGRKGDIVNVAAGFARNYLIPQEKAVRVTPSNMKMIEIEQKALKKKVEQERLSFQDLINNLNDVTLSFKRKSGEKDVIFGSVSVSDIKDELEKQGFEVEKKKILLDEPIKRLGNYTVPVKVYHDDRAEIKVEVIREGGEVEEDKGKTEKPPEPAQETAAQEESAKAEAETVAAQEESPPTEESEPEKEELKKEESEKEPEESLTEETENKEEKEAESEKKPEGDATGE